MGGRQLTTEFVEDIVRWRMGAAYDAAILDWRDSRLNFDNPGMLNGDIACGLLVDGAGVQICAPPQRSSYDPTQQKRLVDAAQDVLKAASGLGQPLALFMAMNDARLFASMEQVGPPVVEHCVQLSYARTVQPYWRARTKIVLWPLTNDFRYWNLPTFAPAPWEQRKPVLLWRGQPTGMSYALGEEARPLFHGIRQVRRWLNGWLKDEVVKDEAQFDLWSGSYQRLRAVSMCRTIPDTDVRLVPLLGGETAATSVAEKFLGKSVVAERMDLKTWVREQQTCKYALSIPGNDVPSSLRQDLLSGCAVLMPRPFWESAWFYGLAPHEHYIPLRADLADLEEKLQWCRDNDAECREMAERARAFGLRNFEPSLEHRVQSRLLERLARQTVPPQA